MDLGSAALLPVRTRGAHRPSEFNGAGVSDSLAGTAPPAAFSWLSRVQPGGCSTPGQKGFYHCWGQET